MSWLAVEKALIKSLTDLSLGYPIIQEANSQERIDKAGASDFWLEVTNLPSETTPLDKNLADQYNGIYQISVYTRQLDEGKAGILAVLDQLRPNYQTGDSFTVDNCTVEIVSFTPSPMRLDGSFNVIDTSIDWFSYIDR